ncbi:MAG TPA: PAS domain S-box protein [Cyclobacteriaceae bacterium]|nr:PAS domain S-box protein [Cyclobacteriaceae bacterium]
MRSEASDIQKAIRQEPVATFLINDSGQVTMSANFDLTRLGFKPAIWTGQSIFQLADDNPHIIESIKKALSGLHVVTEATINGSTFENSYSPLFDVTGKVTYVIGVSIDVTETKRAAEDLQKSEFRFRKLFNSASDAIFMMDNRTFIDCNAATLRIFQCTREQIVGQTPYRFSPSHQPDGRPSEESAMEKINAALSGVPQFFEWKHIRYDGTPFDAEVSLNRLDLNDEVFIQAMVRDISERKKAEEENRRLALVANATTNMVVIADGEGKIEWVNPAFTRITGYALDEVIGKKPGSFLRGPGTDDTVSDFMGQKLCAGEGFKDVEILNYSKDGTSYWVSIEVQPIYDKAGKVVQFIAIESDITERKATQQALLDRHEELVKTNTELDRFVYSASHDLRAPIASLLGLIEVARLEQNVDNIGQLLDMQKRSLLRLDYFIKDIVDHSRNTRLEIESESVNFQAVIHSTFEQLHFMDHFNRIKKVVSVKQENEFYSSPTRLNIIFNNLISNAIKYADIRKDDPYLKIDVKTGDRQVTISIADNGEGIPSESVPKIFDMFFRASSRGTGSGLGLYIVREAIRKLGGTVDVHSEYGKGTEFIVTLPNLKYL